MVTFRTRVVPTGRTAAALEVPPRVVASFGAGSEVPVRVTVNAHSYSATVRRRGARYLVRMGQGHRAEAGVLVGDGVEVTLTHEPGHREVEVPDELAAALETAGLRDAFEALAWSSRKEHARAVREARAASTRARRVLRIVDGLGG